MKANDNQILKTKDNERKSFKADREKMLHKTGQK